MNLTAEEHIERLIRAHNTEMTVEFYGSRLKIISLTIHDTDPHHVNLMYEFVLSNNSKIVIMRPVVYESNSDLTEWFNGDKDIPYHVGEYIASYHMADCVYRWWDGTQWSRSYTRDNPEKYKAMQRATKILGLKSHDIPNTMYWRGKKHAPTEPN
jgi:hypothetical protein